MLDFNKYSDEEKALLRQHYETLGAAAMAEKLGNGRTRGGVYQAARRLGLRQLPECMSQQARNATRSHQQRGPIAPTPEQEAYLRDNWLIQRRIVSEAAMGASRGVVQRWARGLGLGRAASAMPTPARPVTVKARQGARRKLNEDQQQQLRELWGTIPKNQIAPLLGVSLSTLSDYANEMGLPRLRAKVATPRVRLKGPKRVRAKAAARPAPKREVAPEARPAAKKPTMKKVEPTQQSLTSYLRGLAYMHPDRQKYHRLTRAGTPAGTAPRTVAQLHAA